MEFEDADLKNVSNFLLNTGRSGLKIAEGIMAEKRVKVFRGESAVAALTGERYQKLKKVPSASDPQEAASLMKKLLQKGFILRCSRLGNTKNFQPDSSRTWNETGLFAWVYEPSGLSNIIIAVVLLLAVVGIVMYPIWPYRLQRGVWYLLMTAMVFVSLIFLLGIIRLIVFSVTFFIAKPGWWLFPNLFEDCGFFESFQPVGCWHGEDVRPARLRKSDRTD